MNGVLRIEVFAVTLALAACGGEQKVDPKVDCSGPHNPTWCNVFTQAPKATAADEKEVETVASEVIE